MNSSEIIDMLYVNAGNFAVICLAITVLVCLTKFHKFNTPFKRLFYFLVWNLLIEILARIFTYNGINNLPLLHLYTLGEFVLFSWFYESLIEKPKVFRNWFKIIVGLLSAVIILYFLLFNEMGNYNPLTKTMVQLVIITYAILYFYNLTENQTQSYVLDKSLRLINSAVLIYYSGSLFIFMFSETMRAYPEWIKTFWTFNAVLNLIFQLLILLAIWRIVYRRTPSSS